MEELTEFRWPPPKPEPRQHHLSQPKRRTEARKKADGHDAQKVEEYIHKDRINKLESKE